MAKDLLGFTEKYEYYLTSTDEADSQKVNQPLPINLNQPLDQVIEQCHTYLFGQHKGDYQSIPELMKEIEKLLTFLKVEYRRQTSAARSLPSPSCIAQSLKVPLYTDLIKEICAFYKISARRVLLRFLRNHGAYDVADEHIQSADQLDEIRLEKYTNCLVHIAKTFAKETNQEYDEQVTDLLNLLMKGSPQVDADMVLRVGYALGMNSTQVTDFGARVLGDTVLSLKTPEGLIHRYCLDTFAGYKEAMQMLEDYRDQPAQPAAAPNQNSGHTLRIADGYKTVLKNDPDKEKFLKFLRRESPHLNGDSKSARDLYRVLAVYYKCLVEQTLPVPGKPRDLQFTLLNLWGLISASENDGEPYKTAACTTVEKEYRKCSWSADECVIIRKIMTSRTGIENWCYLRADASGNTNTIEKVIFGDRIYSNLLGTYRSLGAELPPEKQRILKEDLLILLYHIIRYAQHSSSAELASELSSVFWYTAEYFLRKLNYGFPNAAAFYIPNPLEYSLFLSIAGNIHLEEMQCELFYSRKDRDKLKTNGSYFEKVWQTREKVESALDTFLSRPDLKLKYSKAQQAGFEELAKEARNCLKNVKSLEQVQQIWVSTVSAISKVKAARTARQIDRIIDKAKNNTTEVKDRDLGQIFRSKLKNLRQNTAKELQTDLSYLMPLVDALYGYFGKKNYVCCAYFKDDGVWASFPDDQEKINPEHCIFRWSDAVPNIMKKAETGIYPQIHAKVADMFKEAEAHSKFIPKNRQNKIRTTEIQFSFMLLCRQLQLRNPALDMKFEIYAKQTKKIKLTASVNFENL